MTAPCAGGFGLVHLPMRCVAEGVPPGLKQPCAASSLVRTAPRGHADTGRGLSGPYSKRNLREKKVMVMKRRTLAILIGQAFASTALISIPATGSAQQAVERVEIPGTNIRRGETETASPVLIITRDDIENSRKATVAEYLRTLPVDRRRSCPAISRH